MNEKQALEKVKNFQSEMFEFLDNCKLDDEEIDDCESVISMMSEVITILENY